MSRLLRICRVVACLLVLALFAVPQGVAWADEGTSADTLGSITLDFSKKKGALDGSTIAIYTVAVADYTDPAHFDTSQGQFAGSDAVAGIPDMTSKDLDDHNRALSKTLEKEVRSKKIKPYRSATVKSNKVSFSDIPQGLYLVCQTKVAKKGQVISSFLMSVPDSDGNVNVVSEPKPDSGQSSHNPKKDADEEESSKKTTRRKTSTSGRTSSSKVTQRLARTGDSLVRAWPFALAGFGALIIGLILRRRRQRGA